MIIQVLHEIIVMSTSTVMADGENILSTREPSFSDQDTLSKKSLWNTQGNALASPKMKNGVHRTPKKKSSRGDSGIDVTPEIFVSPSHEPVSDNSNHTWTQYESETRREQFTENSSENTINNDMSNEDSTKSTHPSSIDQTMSLPNTSPSHSEANVSNTPVRTNRTVRQSTSLTSSYTQSVTISTQNDNPIKQSLIDTNSEERPSPTRSPVPGYRWREIPKRLNLRLSPNDLRATRSLTGSPCMSPLRSLQASRSIDEHLNTSGGLLSPALRLSQTSLRGLPATLDQNQYQHCIVCRTCSTQANQIRPPGRHFVLKWKQIISLMLLLSILVGGGGFLFVELEKNEEHERQQTLHLFFTEFKHNHSITTQNMLEFMSVIYQDAKLALLLMRKLNELALNGTDKCLKPNSNSSDSSNSTKLTPEELYKQHKETGVLPVIWNVANSAGFVISAITTIGYGHVAPKTSLGRIACIIFSIVGIPLMLLLLGGLGEKMRRMTSRFSKCVSLLPCSKRVNRFFNYALIAGFGLLVLFVGPSFALIYFEGWTGVDAVYYCFVSLSTIGFGDLALGDPTSAAHQNNSAGHHIYRVMSLVWVLFGLAYVGIVITSLGHLFIRGSCGANNVETMRLKAELKRLKQEIKAQRLYARRSGLNMTWSSQQMMEGDLTWDSEIIPDNPTPQ